MPRVTIATSLWDPLIIELEEKVYTSVPRSARFLQDQRDLKKKFAEKEISELDYLSQTLGLTFGVNPEEFRTLDRAYLMAFVEEASKYISEGTESKPSGKTESEDPAPNSEPAAPETPEERKNG